jgi:hypothetical protein
MLEVLSDFKAPVGDWSFVPEDSHSIAEYGQTVTMKVHCVPAASSRDRPESDVSSTKLPTVPLTKTRRVVAFAREKAEGEDDVGVDNKMCVLPRWKSASRTVSTSKYGS